jgi:hypothetical protein
MELGSPEFEKSGPAIGSVGGAFAVAEAKLF